MNMHYTINKSDITTHSRCFCGSSDVQKICNIEYKKVEIFATSICTRCGLIFRSTLPSFKWLLDAWAKRENMQQHNDFNFLNEEIEEDRYIRYQQFGKTLRRLNSGKRLLDIGCGTGFGMRALQKNGFMVSGIEPDATRAKVATTKYGLKVTVTTLENYLKTVKKKFEVITMSHSLEHMQNPYSTVSSFEKLLTPTGIIYIEVPDFRYFAKDWNDALYLGHITNFTQYSLIKLMDTFGYFPIEQLNASPEKDDGPYLAFFFSKDKKRSLNILKKDRKISYEDVIIKYSSGIQGLHKEIFTTFVVPTFNDLSLIYKEKLKVEATVSKNISSRKAIYNKIEGKVFVS